LIGGPVLVYQGTCRFCCVATGVVLAWDRGHQVRPVALETPEAAELLAGVPVERHACSWHLVNAEGALFSAGDAFPELFRVLPGGGGLAVLAGARPGLTERAYFAISSRRGSIGRALPDRIVGWGRDLIAARSG
jgi:predicted DCC family thiol-disulfide oxidoreductase YuxK